MSGYSSEAKMPSCSVTPPPPFAADIREPVSLRLPRQSGPGQPASGNRSQEPGEPSEVVRLALVEPVDLLIEVAVKVEGLDGHVGPVEPALEQAPEVFHRVRV